MEFIKFWVKLRVHFDNSDSSTGKEVLFIIILVVLKISDW